mmetsp:Transcript_32649/g.63058  ORF Transcript_32649/g.63058 Transcript_32649/m.63058 type:complete len:226 (+) Transcript_32649:177-854(+)
MGCMSSVAKVRRSNGNCVQVQAELVRVGGGPLGIRLQHGAGGVLVRDIDEHGVVGAWNAQHPSMKVCSGDRVIAVNSVPVDNSWASWCAILAELRKNSVRLVLSPGPVEESPADRAFGTREDSWASLDHLLPEDFMDTMARYTAKQCQVTECSICLEELDPESLVVQLPCSHAFHPRCAESWLTQCPTVKCATCPMCRHHMAPLQMIPRPRPRCSTVGHGQTTEP